MKLYIAGKITGLDPAEAFQLFDAAELQLRLTGHQPLNPMKLVDQDENRTYEDMLLDALRIMICDAEAVYMLNNWQNSRGARIEHYIAQTLSRPISYQPPVAREVPA